MTPVVLVEHPIPTSERREWRAVQTEDTSWAGRKGDILTEWIGDPEPEIHSALRIERRTVTVAGPVFVPLEGVTCPKCLGIGCACAECFPGSKWPNCIRCGRCNGSGVVAPDLGDKPTLLAEWQWRARSADLVEPWRDGPPKITARGVLNAARRPFDEVAVERRQVVRFQAHDKLLLPVVDSDPRNHPAMDVAANTEWSTYVPRADKSAWDRLPERVDAGRFVARFDGLEAVEPITERIDPTAVLLSNPPQPKRVPLDLQPGVVHRIEVAA